MARTSRKTKTAQEPEPDLTVSAVVTVFVGEGGEARVVIKVDTEGATVLVELMKLSSGKLNIVGSALRRAVMNALGCQMDGAPTDLQAVAAKAGRA